MGSHHKRIIVKYSIERFRLFLVQTSVPMPNSALIAYEIMGCLSRSLPTPFLQLMLLDRHIQSVFRRATISSFPESALVNSSIGAGLPLSSIVKASAINHVNL